MNASIDLEIFHLRRIPSSCLDDCAGVGDDGRHGEGRHRGARLSAGKARKYSRDHTIEEGGEELLGWRFILEDSAFAVMHV